MTSAEATKSTSRPGQTELLAPLTPALERDASAIAWPRRAPGSGLASAVLTLLGLSIAFSAGAQIYEPPRIDGVQANRAVRVIVQADEKNQTVEKESVAAGPFVDLVHATETGEFASQAWGEAWQRTTISPYSIRGTGGASSRVSLGGGEFANVKSHPESGLSMTFTVTADGPFTLDASFEAEDTPHSVSWAPSASILFTVVGPGGGLQWYDFSYVAGSGDEATVHADGFVEAGSQLTLAVVLWAGREAEGEDWDHPGEAMASFEFVLSFGDRDGDGIPDQWEEEGIDFSGPGIEIDLPAMGADPDHKDVFVELDRMEDAWLDLSALDLVIEAFAEAPASMVDNPGGEKGINLHIVYNPDDLLPTIPLGGSEAHFAGQFAGLKDGFFGTLDHRQHPEREQIEAIRRRIFRYGVWADILAIDNKPSGGQALGADFVLAASQIRFEYPTVESLALAGMLMHEIGHTLGLRHGGQDDVNYKPNYLSVMNYAYSQPYQKTDPFFELLNRFWKPDYSRETMRTLDEGLLFESQGLDGPGDRYVVYNSARFDDPDPVVRVPARANSVPIDWNYNDLVEDPVPALDLNRRDENQDLAHNDLHRSFSDWDRLIYSIPLLETRSGLASEVRGATTEPDLVLEDLAAFADVPWDGEEALLQIFDDDFESGSIQSWSSAKH